MTKRTLQTLSTASELRALQNRIAVLEKTVARLTELGSDIVRETKTHLQELDRAVAALEDKAGL